MAMERMLVRLYSMVQGHIPKSIFEVQILDGCPVKERHKNLLTNGRPVDVRIQFEPGDGVRCMMT